ncbi:MAG: hypothetical protein UZ14_CFX002000784 [Chloroflexi bacterium OLB14]|nr:MAG: hypothetical protein UZ14_CFX002000784 [Chloroflexi bacterium OLB14]
MTPIIALGFLFLTIFLFLVVFLFIKKYTPQFREILALTRLARSLGLSVEDGKRLHISLGHSSLLDERGGSAFAGLSALRIISEKTSVSDMPPVASAGDAALGLLTQDTMQAGYQAAGVEELYVHTTSRVTGLTPFSYTVGAMYIASDENVSTNIMLGHFGAEASLLADVADRNYATLIGASDNLAGQSVLYASTQDALIGEELFATGAYLDTSSSHSASLIVQDILRWLIIITLLGGSALKFIGVF